LFGVQASGEAKWDDLPADAVAWGVHEWVNATGISAANSMLMSANELTV
jgi:hypothetical protein